MSFGEIDDFKHFDDFIELLHDLLDDAVVTGGDDGDHRGRWIQRRRHRQTLDVITAGAKQTGDSGEHAEFVLNENRYDVFHSPKNQAGRTPSPSSAFVIWAPPFFASFSSGGSSSII